MTIEDLYPRVTDAILRAEGLERTGPQSEARAAYLDVSMLEEAVADELPVSDPEGQLARRGAVRAALRAEMFLRAKELADRFLQESGVPMTLVSELRAWLGVSEEALHLDALQTVFVEPAARYRFPDAA